MTTANVLSPQLAAELAEYMSHREPSTYPLAVFMRTECWEPQRRERRLNRRPGTVRPTVRRRERRSSTARRRSCTAARSSDDGSSEPPAAPARRAIGGAR